MATGWAPVFYSESFDTRDLITVASVMKKQNKRSSR